MSLWVDFLEYFCYSNGELLVYWMFYIGIVENVLFGFLCVVCKGNWDLYFSVI